MIKRVAVLVAIVAVVAMLALPVFADSVDTFYAYWDDSKDGVYFVDTIPGPGIYNITYDCDLEVDGDFNTYSNTSVKFDYHADGYLIGYFVIDYGQGHDARAEIYPDGSIFLWTRFLDGVPLESFEMTFVSALSPAGQPGSDNEEGGVLVMVESVVAAIFAVFTAIGDWFVEFLPTLTALFWTGEALTFLGVLAILGLGVSVIFLLINVIRGFLNFGH